MPRRLAAPVKIGITGLPGSGKTQTLLRIIQLLEQEGISVGGMVTEPIVEKQRRTGFQITNWLTKEHAVFAHENFKSRIRSGRYGVNLPALFRHLATFVDKIIRGTRAGEIPIEFPTTLELWINQKTAKSFGLIIPPTLLVRADEVIE